MMETLTITLAVTSLVGNVIAVGVVLYVKAQIAPLMVKLDMQSSDIASMKANQREDINALWKEIGDMRERIARSEASKETARTN